MHPESSTPTPPRTRDELAALKACARCGHPRSVHLRAYGQDSDGFSCVMADCSCLGARGFLFA